MSNVKDITGIIEFNRENKSAFSCYLAETAEAIAADGWEPEIFCLIMGGDGYHWPNYGSTPRYISEDALLAYIGSLQVELSRAIKLHQELTTNSD